MRRTKRVIKAKEWRAISNDTLAFLFLKERSPSQSGTHGPTACVSISGDHSRKEIPVPIPNTVVKLSVPMIVPTSAKVGIARFLSSSGKVAKPRLGFGPNGVFCVWGGDRLLVDQRR